jgi:hypothetical protein
MKIEGAKTRAGIVMSSAEARSKLMLEGSKMNLEYQMFKEKLAADKQQHAAEMAYKYASLNRSSDGGSRSSGSPVSRSSGSPVSDKGGLDGTNFVPPDDPYPSDAAAVNPFAESPVGQARMDIVDDMGVVSRPGEGKLVVFRPDGSDRSGTGYITREDGTGVYIDGATRDTEARIGTFTADNAPEGAPPGPTQDNTFVGPVQPAETTPD